MNTYVIQQGFDGPVKIGKSAAPRARLEQLKTGSPSRLYLRGIIDDDIERYLHSVFHADRLHGEWFRASLDMQRILCMMGIAVNVPADQPSSPLDYRTLADVGLPEPPKPPTSGSLAAQAAVRQAMDIIRGRKAKRTDAA